MILQRSLRSLFPFAIVLCGPTSLLACQQSAEGDRCNPLLLEDSPPDDECNSGLACTTLPSCGSISICCPVHGPATSAECMCVANPATCVCAEDAGIDAPDVGAAGDADSAVDGGKDASHD